MCLTTYSSPYSVTLTFAFCDRLNLKVAHLIIDVCKKMKLLDIGLTMQQLWVDRGMKEIMN